MESKHGQTIRVMVADDHRIFADALAARLQAEDDFEFVGMAHRSETAERMARNLRPDVLLLDVEFADGDGVEVARRLQEDAPEVRIVMLTAHDEAATAAVEAGVSGFLSKDASTQEVVGAIRAAARGWAWIQSRLLRIVLDDLTVRESRLTADEVKVKRLTHRELEVFSYMVQGFDRARIARTLYLSTNTVRTHVRNVLSKLDVHSSLEAVALGMRAGLGDLGPRQTAWRSRPTEGSGPDVPQ